MDAASHCIYSNPVISVLRDIIVEGIETLVSRVTTPFYKSRFREYEMLSTIVTSIC